MSNEDAATLATFSASTTVGVTDLPSGFTSAGAFQFGLTDYGMTIDPGITINITVASSYEGRNLTIYSKTPGGSWAYLTGCTVSGNICTFTTEHLSDFSAAQGSSSGSSGGSATVASYCSSVTYGDWASCVNGVQTRSVTSQSPSGCSLTTTQSMSAQRTCGTNNNNNNNNTNTNTTGNNKVVAFKSTVGYVGKLKGGNGDIYYIENGIKHRFLNPTVMKSWFFKSDAASTKGVDWAKAKVKEISASDYNALIMGSDVSVKNGGNFLIQFGVGTTIYAVGLNSELYKIDSPSTAKKLFGNTWGKKVVIFPGGYNNDGRYSPISGTLTGTSKLPF
jgi:hypothetical protein